MAWLREQAYQTAMRLRGYPIGRYLGEYADDDRACSGLDIQRRQLSRLLRFAVDHVPRYRSRVANSRIECDPIAALNAFPILTKSAIRQRFSDLLSDDLGRRRWFYNTSGGSTGEPVRFVQDARYVARSAAIEQYFLAWTGKRPGDYEVRLWGSERDIFKARSNWKSKCLSSLANVRILNSFSMSEARMAEYLEHLATARIGLVVAYAQSMYELARFAARRGSSMAHTAPAILTSAGMLYPFMRRQIQSTFECPVFNRYGSREVGAIASQCGHNPGLHVAPWGSFLEIVDDAGNPSPPGSEGRILVTCLTNYAMPLIRYDIGDLGVLDQPGPVCACGRSWQTLRTLCGRSVDTFRTKDRTLVDGEYFTHLLYFRDWVEQFQVVQSDYQTVRFNIVGDRSRAPAGELAEISSKTRLVMGQDCDVDFAFVDAIDTTRSGKRRFTVSLVDQCR